jgi:hypothetical protein
MKLADQTLGTETLMSKISKSMNVKDFTKMIKIDISKLDDAIRKLTKREIGKPFAGYKDFDDCVAQNSDKDNPEAYCGSIQAQVEGTKKQNGEPKTDVERAKVHFNISEEDWKTFSDEEKQKYINQLPKRGSGRAIVTKFIECPVDGIITKSNRERLDKALIMLTGKPVI